MLMPFLANQVPGAQSLADTYGPYAFGLVALLAIWYLIVAPQLKANKADTDKIEEIATTQAETAKLLVEVARRLEAVTARLEAMRVS